MTQHEVLGGMAHLRTIHEQADMMGLGMFAAFLEAVVDLMQTGIVTLSAVMDAFMHFRGLMFMNV